MLFPTPPLTNAALMLLITEDCGDKNCKPQSLMEASQGKPKHIQGDKNEDMKGDFSL